MKKISAGHRKLFDNTLMLYLLTFSNYFFSFITVPFQTRILGPEIYGNIGFASSFMIYFSLILDFGFLLSATEDVSIYKDDSYRLSQIMTAVTLCKILLAGITTLFFGILCVSVSRLRADPVLFILYYLSSLISAFLPDFLYRGLERMRAITIRSVMARIFFTILIFIFLREKEQYYLIPFFTLLGNIGAVVLVYFHVSRILNVKFCRIKKEDVIYTLKKSSMFFYSRVASTVYSATNTFVLGIIYGNSSTTVGYYIAADKLVGTAKQGMTPITDSLYPYMISHRDFRLVKRIVFFFLPIITAGCAVTFIWADEICALFFGEEFRNTGLYLRLMLPILWCSFPAMIFGFPIMSPLGLTKYANLSNIFGAFIQIIQMIILLIAGKLSAVNICIITCITEILTMLYRIGVVGIHMKRNGR